MAAPPVLVFDAAGNFIQAWGGPGNGYQWPEREHGIHIDYQGFGIVEQDMFPAPFDKPLPIAKRTRAYLRDIGLG